MPCSIQKRMLTLTSADLALPTIVADVLPFGVKGLVVAGLFAALRVHFLQYSIVAQL